MKDTKEFNLNHENPLTEKGMKQMGLKKEFDLSELRERWVEYGGKKVWFYGEVYVRQFIRLYIGIINRQQGELSKPKLIKSLKKLAGKNLSGDL